MTDSTRTPWWRGLVGRRSEAPWLNRFTRFRRGSHPPFKHWTETRHGR